MRIAMIGTGYVGLVTGTCFSEFGVDVTCVDLDQTKIDNLKKGVMPIFEPGLDTLVENNVSAGRLNFTTDLKAAVKDADAVFIAVGTPTRRGGGARGPKLRLCGRKGYCRGDERIYGGGHQIHRAGRHW